MIVLLDTLYFSIRYTPWWAVPSIGICGYFFYIYRLKDIRRSSNLFGLCALVSFLCLCYYIYMGGPEGAVGYLQELFDKWQ